ncbi:MAG: 50S ribosomal protein L6 [Deltaproteobacteria bacterium]|nr:50S ribosomal protein L6 [Deltaproteobacteria bacterium]
MSRIGKMPVKLPQGVTAVLKGSVLEVKGPKGRLIREFRPEMTIEVAGDEIRVSRPSDLNRHRGFHGLTRNLIANMVRGVSEGFTRVLEINGVGYRAVVQGKSLELHLGYSQPVHFPLKDGVEAQVEKNTVTLKSINKELLGQVAADIRDLRPPEPYKGKGIKYAEEKILRKAGKTTK